MGRIEDEAGESRSPASHRSPTRGDDHGDGCSKLTRADWSDSCPSWTSEWEAAQVFPVRYPCTEEEYFALDYNLLLEYADGFLEVLPMPTI